ncbi:MAG TPA: CAP domain-containing protein [Solirubrobacteraceae bacterium]
MAVCPTPAVASACPGADLDPAPAAQPGAAAAVVCLVNRERTTRKLPALRDSALLRAAAGRYARRMVSGGFFDHVSPTGSTLRVRLARVGYPGGAQCTLGENIATGSGQLGAPSAIVAAWMASPGHRRNILARDFRDVGIGVASGMPGAGAGATYVADFGRRG